MSSFFSSSTFSTGFSGAASDCTCSGPGGRLVSRATGATASGAKSTTIAPEGSAASSGSRQLTKAAAMAPCASSTTAPQIAQRRDPEVSAASQAHGADTFSSPTSATFR